jgi:hypothetical protein
MQETAYLKAMANIKTRYAQITRQSKQKRPAKGQQAKTPAALEEARLALKIRQRARADYRTVRSAS